MVDRNASCELRNVNVNGMQHPDKMMKLTTGKQADWNLALGSCYGGMVAEVTSNGNIYEMKYRYYIIDIYEWAGHEIDADDLSLMFHRLHEICLSHQYLFSGYYEGTISWKKGQTTADENIMQQINDDLGE